jgi:hypothetical protein
MSKPTINEEIKKLCGIGPRYNFSEAAPVKDPAGVASKEYEGAPGTKEKGGEVGAGTGMKDASVGGAKEGPGVNDKMSKAPGTKKDGGEAGAGTGNKEAGVGGVKSGPGQNDI